MRKSKNYEMILLDEDEFYNEEQFNENTEKMDEVMKSLDTPEYDVSEQTKVEQLKSGESIKIALRKLAKAVADYIRHKADQVVHITEEERTAWNAKLGAEKIAANLTTDTDGMVLDATMGKSLKDSIDTLNSNFSGIKKKLASGDSAYIYIDDGDWYGGIVLISIWRETSSVRGIYIAQPGNGNNANSLQKATVTTIKELSSISIEAAADSKYSTVKITNNHTSDVFVRAVALCGSQPAWLTSN